MNFIINKEDKSLVPCKETDFSSKNLSIRETLTLCIEKHPSVLGEELLIITDEYHRFDKTSGNLNFLALDRGGNLVIIEARCDESKNWHALQTLSYAADCFPISISDLIPLYVNYQKKKGIDLCQVAAEADVFDFIDNMNFKELNYRSRIIFVARAYPQEIVSSVLWLRRFSLDITCVKWHAYDFADHKTIFNFQVLIPSVDVREPPRFRTDGVPPIHAERIQCQEEYFKKPK